MSAKKLTLKSGNTFYYRGNNGELVSVAFIANPQGQFLGGFAGKEADRKLKAFSLLEGTSVSDIENLPNMNQFNFDMFGEWIGSASKLLKDHLNFVLIDIVHGGASSASKACGERSYYFDAVGLSEMFETRIGCPLWAIIANHLSVFGTANFRETFFKGAELETASSDNSLDDSIAKTRYTKRSFKAPAYYLRHATMNS